ncbi:TspO/MBR-related protein [Exidia glandulosa HHB12029]|uniref:TspO/MBR-related protein n=1 Tax=Exidia glandulosa HHB12029 TaxID=1314781 RepID=A0A165JFE6_EXIGL|nr:TspO/MBR-related protein [Exidia glandulosa HHB12029]
MSTFNLPPFLLNTARIPAVAVGLPLVAGWLSGSQTYKVIDGRWYRSLVFPPLYPPRAAFPIAWTTLYFGMGWASHVAAQAVVAGRPGAELGLGLYYAQLGMNLAWSPLFFTYKQTGWALLDIAALTATNFYMTSILHEATDGWTSYALVPYCAWLSYATYLNASLWWLNKDRHVPKYD